MTIPWLDGPVLTPGAAEDARLGDIGARRALVADKLFAARHQLGGAVAVTAADHLEGLALGAAAARAATRFRALDVLAAVRAGATWDEAAAATGLPVGELLTEVRAWEVPELDAASGGSR